VTGQQPAQERVRGHHLDLGLADGGRAKALEIPGQEHVDVAVDARGGVQAVAGIGGEIIGHLAPVDLRVEAITVEVRAHGVGH
jgi:hypothetical protein